MSRPTIKRGPASGYALPGETIVEIFSRELQRGCLLSVRESKAPDGSPVLEISPYRGDKGVQVIAGGRSFKVSN